MSRWFNAAAVEWVMYHAPGDLPPGPAWTLAVVASFTGSDGRAAYPSTERIAELTHRSKRQVQRDLDQLARDGLLMPGDPAAVAKLRADRRPDVWDLSIRAREQLVDHGERGDVMSSRTGRHDVAPPDSRGDKSAAHGMTKTFARGDTMSPEKNMKRTRKDERRAERLCSNRQPIAADGTCCPEHDAA